MTFGGALLDAASAVRLGAFAVAFAALATWELAAPARALRLGRTRRWRANLGIALLNALIVRFAFPTTALALAALGEQQGWGLLNRVALPPWLAVALGAVLLDFAIYLQHVLFHMVPALMRLHAAHHADADFDLTTGIRFHPLEIVLSTLLKFAAIAAFGAPVLAVLVFELLLNVSVMFNHSNVSLPPRLERWVRRVLVTPDMHRIHHSVVELERNSNYGFCIAVWDRFLGTYRDAPQGALEIGLASWRDRWAIASLPGVLSLPFLRPR